MSPKPLPHPAPLARLPGVLARFGWRRWLSIGFLVAFVASFALAGFSIVFCRSMGQAQLSCCCHGAGAQQDGQAVAGDKGPQLDRAPSCETRHFDSATTTSSAASDPSPAVAPASVAILPPGVALVADSRARDLLVIRQERPLPQGRAPPPLAVHLRTVRLLC